MTGTEFYDQLTPDEAAALARVSRRREYRRGAVIMREGDRSDWSVVLQSGRVKVALLRLMLPLRRAVALTQLAISSVPLLSVTFHWFCRLGRAR